MGYTVESDGSRRYKLSSKSEIISPADGQDFRVDKVKTRVGRLAMTHGRVFRPVEEQDDPLNVLSVNGWSAPAAAYYGTAGKMAAMGVTTALYDTYKFLDRTDIKDPLDSAHRGGLAMLDVMTDLAGEHETALIGHSMGAVTAWRMALEDERVLYVVGEAPVGIQHRNMHKVYPSHMKAMLKDEFWTYLKSLPRDKFGLRVAMEFMALNGMDPSRLARQVWMLGHGPDLAPNMAKAHENGILNGIILHHDDEFFHVADQQEVIDRKRHLIDALRVVDGTKHLHPNMYPLENARIRVDMLDELRGIRRLGATALTAGE